MSGTLLFLNVSIYAHDCVCYIHTYAINRELMLLIAVIPSNNYKLWHVIGFYHITPHFLHKTKNSKPGFGDWNLMAAWFAFFLPTGLSTQKVSRSV